MKRGIVFAILIFLFFILQSTAVQAIAVGGSVPNLPVILVVSVAFFRGKKTGLLTGFFYGLLNDFFFGDILGFYAMTYMFIGYVCGFFSKEFYEFDLRLPLLLIAASDLVYCMVVYWCLFMMRSRMNFLFYFTKIILPELIFTVAAAIIVYRILYLINEALTLDEKRGDSYFV